ncbi:hypothetical protein [Brevundimonas sp.]|uniref:hypothetical protein n=1 Tax=Brevundimonas sp. TaxID=1871086 RepID=UPI003BAC186F
MTPEPMTIEQLTRAVDALTEKAMVAESLTSDVLALLVDVDRDSMIRLRDASIHALAKLEPMTDDASVEWRGFWAGRVQLLEAVLSRAGSPWQPCDVVDFAEARDAMPVRWGPRWSAAQMLHGNAP